MPYYKGTNGDFVVEADTYDEAVAAIDRRILAGNVPVLEVEEVDMTFEEAEGYGTLEEPEGPYVFIESDGGVVGGVQIFFTEEEADKAFEAYTGMKDDELYDEHGQCTNNDYDQCKVLTLGTYVKPLDDNFEKPEGIVILPGFYPKIARDKWIYGLKKKLGGIQLLVNQKLVSRDGPPGFDTVYATNIAWIINWKPYENENDEARMEWSRTIPLDIASALDAGAIDLRG